MMENNNVVICYPNRINEGVLSGGSWLTSLPLTNIANRIIKKRARSTNTDFSSTQFNVVWPLFRPVGVVAIAGHNFSVTADIRIRLYYDELMTDLVYDSGLVPAWPAIYSTETLEWEDNNFWFGTVNQDEREAFTPLFVNFVKNEVESVGIGTVAKSMKVEIFDAANPTGYVELGRLFFGDVYMPTRNANLGLSYQYSTSTEVETALDDTEYFDRRNPKRNVSIVLDRIETSEMFGRVFDLQRTQGIDGEVLFAYSTIDDENAYARRFLGRLSTLDPIAEPYVDRRHSVPINITEII